MRLFQQAALALTMAMICSNPSLAFESSLSSYIQDPMPEWYSEGFARGHLNIALMLKAGYSRLEAIEIQNTMKDLLEVMPEYIALEKAGLGDDLFLKRDPLVLKALSAAIAEVKQKGRIESGFKPEVLKDHEFYVAFDMDETLLTQWYESGQKGDAYRDLSKLPKDFILRPDLVGPDYISLTPGWEKAFLDLAAIPGCKGVLIFSAKEDAAAHAIVDRLRIQGKPLRNFLKGVFTRNHLTRESKAEKLSKDLRIIDESLKHVIIIDDNPTRIFPSQQDNLREFPKYNPDAYYTARDSKSQISKQLIEQLMPTIVSEIKEAADYSKQHQMAFNKAFYPYSMGGQTELIYLLKQGYNMSDAIDFLRHERELFEPKFFVPKGGTP